MKRCLLVALVALLGLAAAYADAAYITHPWINLGLRQIVGQRLTDVGLDSLAGLWVIVWMHLPEWTIAFAAGIVLRLIFGANMTLYGICFCVGFAVIPQLQFVVDRDTWVFGAAVIVSSFLWSLTCFPIALIAGSMPLLRPIESVTPNKLRFSIQRLLLVTCVFALLFLTVTHSRLLGLPCVVLGTLGVIAYNATQDARDKSTITLDSTIAEP